MKFVPFFLLLPAQAGAIWWLVQCLRQDGGTLAWAAGVNVGLVFATWAFSGTTFNRVRLQLGREQGMIAFPPFGFTHRVSTQKIVDARIGSYYFEGNESPVVDIACDNKEFRLMMYGHSLETMKWLCKTINAWSSGEVTNGTFHRRTDGIPS